MKKRETKEESKGENVKFLPGLSGGQADGE